jgi:hypothetical protein
MAEQKFLFGDADKVYSTLVSEKLIINDEIDSVQKKIDRLEDRMDVLNERVLAINQAMELLVKKEEKKK